MGSPHLARHSIWGARHALPRRRRIVPHRPRHHNRNAQWTIFPCDRGKSPVIHSSHSPIDTPRLKLALLTLTFILNRRSFIGTRPILRTWCGAASPPQCFCQADITQELAPSVASAARPPPSVLGRTSRWPCQVSRCGCCQPHVHTAAAVSHMM